MSGGMLNAEPRTPEKLLDQVEASGATLTRDAQGVVKISGAVVPQQLLAALREQRTSVIEAWEQRRRADRDRYGRVPSADARMLAREMDLSERWRTQIMAYMMRQPRPVHAWVMARANDYYERGVKADDCEWRACVDVIGWQRTCGGQEAAQFVLDLPPNHELGIENAHDTYKETNAIKSRSVKAGKTPSRTTNNSVDADLFGHQPTRKNGVGNEIQQPFLKWAGSKRRLVGVLLPYLAQSGRRYLEPFIGSGAIFLNADFPSSVLSDVNSDLINLYTVLKVQGPVFIRACGELFVDANNNAEAFYRLRDEFNRSGDLERRAALFVYLNRHCFNGLCRFNRLGQFNTPFGKYDHPYFPEGEMIKFAKKLQQAELTCLDFRHAFKQIGAGDVVYCDPPYVPLTNTANFTDYSSGGFSERDHRDLADLAMRAADKGAHVLISNHDTEFTRQLYREATTIVSVLVSRTISCNGANRQPAKELISVFTRADQHSPVFNDYYERGLKADDYEYRGQAAGQ